MSYSTRKEYTFMPGMSVGDHRKDLITTINVPTASAYYQMREANFFTAFGLDTVLSSLEYKMWVTHTAEELIWGYDEPLFEVAKFTLPNPPALEKFGFFVGANATENLSTYTMYTGEGNPYNLSKIHRFNGEQRLKYWKTDQCNQVIGSDAATFNPYIQKEETLWFFNDQLCRSMPLVFEKKVVSRTLPGYRFVPRPDVFMSPKSHPENDCYCVDKTLCSMLGDGMFGISKCQFDAPIVLSWPHFLNAEEKFINSVEGLRPNKDRHGFWFDIQGTTGTTLSAKARLQINIALKRSDTFDAMSKINDTILPAIWFEEGLDELGDDLIDVIGEAVHGPPQYKNYLLSTLLGLGLSTFVIGVVAAVRHCLDRRLGPNRRDDALREVAKRLTDMQQINNHGGQHQHSGPRRLSAFVEEVCQPMLGSSGFASGATTDECSRATTATHSRNASDGSSIPVEPGAADDAERLRLILDSKAGTDAPV
jgi:scavenger receptor class B protein 1